MIKIIAHQRYPLGWRITADQEVGKIILRRPRQRAAAEDCITLEVEAFDRALLSVSVNAIAELIEDQIINYLFRTSLVLQINAVAVAAIRRGALPAVIEDHTTINLN